MEEYDKMPAPQKLSELFMESGRAKMMMPDMDVMPTTFKNYRNNPYCQVASDLFYKGGRLSDWQAREGIVKQNAIDNLRTLLKSVDTQHEHKMAVAGWMIYSWFEPETVGLPVKADA